MHTYLSYALFEYLNKKELRHERDPREGGSLSLATSLVCVITQKKILGSEIIEVLEIFEGMERLCVA